MGITLSNMTLTGSLSKLVQVRVVQVSVHEHKQDMLLDSEEKLKEGGKRVLVQMKGERILALCACYACDGEGVALEEEKREAILKGVGFGRARRPRRDGQGDGAQSEHHLCHVL